MVTVCSYLAALTSRKDEYMTTTEPIIVFLVYPNRDGVIWCASCYIAEQEYLPYETEPLTAAEYAQVVLDEMDSNETPRSELNCVHCGKDPQYTIGS